MRRILFLACFLLFLLPVQGGVEKEDSSPGDETKVHEDGLRGREKKTKRDRGTSGSDDWRKPTERSSYYKWGRTLEDGIARTKSGQANERGVVERWIRSVEKRLSGLRNVREERATRTEGLKEYDREKRGISSDNPASVDLADSTNRLKPFSLTSGEDVPESADTLDAEEKLKELEHLRAVLLSEAAQGQHTIPETEIEERYAPCEAPWEEVAYHMCILQEVTLKLPWEEAQRYCWRNGGELAEDSVVIKTRRFLNDLYGEEGSRVRWPIWVGGKSEDGEWRWRSGSQVLDFLWASEQPRNYPPTLTPHGTCMILDGYQRFYGASLPCHLKRRFVCQRRE